MHEFSLSHIPRKAWPGAVFGENGQSYEVDADFRTVLKCLRVLRDEDIRERDRLYLPGWLSYPSKSPLHYH